MLDYTTVRVAHAAYNIFYVFLLRRFKFDMSAAAVTAAS